MVKSDLGSGMVIELRNGTKYMVAEVGDKMFGCGACSSWLNMDRYTDQMMARTRGNSSKFDIMKVYVPEQISTPRATFNSTLKLIWSRKRRMTVSQIETALGYGVEIIAEPTTTGRRYSS